MNNNDKCFYVVAGKYDDNEINCKYTSEPHETLDEAFKDFDRVSNYVWAYIQYKDRTISVMHKGFKLFE